MNQYQKLVEKLGEEGARAEMKRRSALRTPEQKNQGYFKRLKDAGKLDELSNVSRKGGSVPRVSKEER
jgi:hypothetical protein